MMPMRGSVSRRRYGAFLRFGGSSPQPPPVNCPDECLTPTPPRRAFQVFTRWANAYLKQRGHALNDFADLQNGVMLAKLLEILTSKAIKVNE